MSEIGIVRHLIGDYLAAYESDGRVAIPTQCLYPSNSSVTVFVSGGTNEVSVSDDGGAIDELSAHGLFVDDADKFLRPFCKRAGLDRKEGVIYSPTVPIGNLAAAVVMVANASSSAAHWGVERMRSRVRRDIKIELQTLLRTRFASERIHSHTTLAGQSTRQYHFDYIVEIGGKKRLVMDSVYPDASSVNAKTIAHLDLKQTKDEALIQRIVYDDNDNWSSADLNLLRIAATVTPFSALNQQLDRLTIH